MFGAPALQPPPLPHSTLVFFGDTPGKGRILNPAQALTPSFPTYPCREVPSGNIPDQVGRRLQWFKHGKPRSPLIYKPTPGVANMQSLLPEHPQTLSYPGPSAFYVDL